MYENMYVCTYIQKVRKYICSSVLQNRGTYDFGESSESTYVHMYANMYVYVRMYICTESTKVHMFLCFYKTEEHMIMESHRTVR